MLLCLFAWTPVSLSGWFQRLCRCAYFYISSGFCYPRPATHPFLLFYEGFWMLCHQRSWVVYPSAKVNSKNYTPMDSTYQSTYPSRRPLSSSTAMTSTQFCTQWRTLSEHQLPCGWRENHNNTLICQIMHHSLQSKYSTNIWHNWWRS